MYSGTDSERQYSTEVSGMCTSDSDEFSTDVSDNLRKRCRAGRSCPDPIRGRNVTAPCQTHETIGAVALPG